MSNDKLDRLYDLLPVVYHARDQEQGYPLRALLQVIAEQVNLIEDDISQLYENWFIETCEDWVAAYIGDLVGYQSLYDQGEALTAAVGTAAASAAPAGKSILSPRRDIGDTIHNRRRKGTLAILEELVADVAGWPARAVEFYRLLGWTQHLNHMRLSYGRTADLRNNDALAQIDDPFDSIAHTVDVRRIATRQTPGRYSIPSVGLFVWRLKPYTVTRVPACCVEEAGPQCYSFSVLGNDTRLVMKPLAEPDPTHIAEEENLPVSIRRWSFEAYKGKYYGEGKSIQIWAPGWCRQDSAKPLSPEAIVPADLSDWSYLAPLNHVAVDPVLGRMVFPPSQLPREGLRVSYLYAFSDDVGGGEYRRPLSQPAICTLVRIGGSEEIKRISDAWNRIQRDWASDPAKPQNGVIEITDSGVYVEQLLINLRRGQSLQIRAANRVRPVLRLIDWQTDMPDALCIALSPGGHLTLDGLLIAERPVAIRAAEMNGHSPSRAMENVLDVCSGNEKPFDTACPARVDIRHCTLVPGWGLDLTCKPRRPAEPCLEFHNVQARIRIEHSIVGSIQIHEDQVHTEPIPITILDSILDATGDDREALGAPGRPVAHAILTICRSTVFGKVLVHAIGLAENSIFTNCLSVARRQLGCMRFCYIPSHCRTPRRYHCQPDLAEQIIAEHLQAENPGISQMEIDRARALERERVRPQFYSVRYGRQDYAQLADICAEEIKCGADDESEMGVFHNLYNPQREANVRARLNEYTPAGMEAGIISVT